MTDVRKHSPKNFGYHKSSFVVSGVEENDTGRIKLPKLQTETFPSRQGTDIQRFSLVNRTNSPEYVSPRQNDKPLGRTSSVAEHLELRRTATLKASEIPYEKRIKALEVENERLSKNYQRLYRENQTLRGKLETGSSEPGHAETYKRLASDRDMLRETEGTYRKRINKLQDEAKEMTSRLDAVLAQNDELQKRTISLDELKIERMQDKKMISDLQTKLAELKNKLKRKANEHGNEVRIRELMEKETAGLKAQLADMKKKAENLKKELSVVQSSYTHR